MQDAFQTPCLDPGMFHMKINCFKPLLILRWKTIRIAFMTKRSVPIMKKLNFNTGHTEHRIEKPQAQRQRTS